jgi:uncharacterized protein (TIGR02246 family)
VHDTARRVTEIVKQLEQAWNTADGEAFGRPFTEDADFVNIRGLHFRSRKVIEAQNDLRIAAFHNTLVAP